MKLEGNVLSLSGAKHVGGHMRESSASDPHHCAPRSILQCISSQGDPHNRACSCVRGAPGAHGKQRRANKKARRHWEEPHGQEGYTHTSLASWCDHQREHEPAKPASFESGRWEDGSVGWIQLPDLAESELLRRGRDHWLAALGVSVKDRAKWTSSCLSLAWGRLSMFEHEALARRMRG